MKLLPEKQSSSEALENAYLDFDCKKKKCCKKYKKGVSNCKKCPKL